MLQYETLEVILQGEVFLRVDREAGPGLAVRGDALLTPYPVDVDQLEIDSQGLDEMDKRLLEVLIYKFNGGPVGLNSLAVAVGEDAATIEEVHEPFLIMQGYLMRTPRGRMALPSAYEKIGAQKPPPGPENPQQDLL